MGQKPKRNRTKILYYGRIKYFLHCGSRSFTVAISKWPSEHEHGFQGNPQWITVLRAALVTPMQCGSSSAHPRALRNENMSKIENLAIMAGNGEDARVFPGSWQIV